MTNYYAKRIGQTVEEEEILVRLPRTVLFSLGSGNSQKILEFLDFHDLYGRTSIGFHQEIRVLGRPRTS